MGSETASYEGIHADLSVGEREREMWAGPEPLFSSLWTDVFLQSEARRLLPPKAKLHSRNTQNTNMSQLIPKTTWVSLPFGLHKVVSFSQLTLFWFRFNHWLTLFQKSMLKETEGSVDWMKNIELSSGNTVYLMVCRQTAEWKVYFIWKIIN